MLRRATISNFGSLGGQTQVDFGSLTALVGPNGSGKSNVLLALRFVADSLQMGLSGAITRRSGIDAVRRWSAGHPFNVEISLEVRLAGGSGTYRFELRGDRAEEYSVKLEEAELFSENERHYFRVENGEWKDGPLGLRPQADPQTLALTLVAGDSRFAPLAVALQSISVYSIFPDTLRTPQRYSPQRPMDAHGQNWASILKDQPSRTWKPDLVRALQKLTGDIEDLRVSPVAGYLAVQFRHASETRKPKWFDASQESDGTLRVAGIITALLQDPPVPVVGIEEPELTVHPGAMPLLFDYLQQASRFSQVVVTTHSPELLDLFETDAIRVVQRHGGVTTVAPLAREQRDAVRTGLLTLGDILRTEGLQQDLSFEVAEER